MVYRHPMLYALLSLLFLVIAIVLALLGIFVATTTLQGTLISLGLFMLIPTFTYFSLYNEEAHEGGMTA